MKLADIASLLANSCDLDRDISGICIDSRRIQPHELFIAIRGERFDGHDFITAAERAGSVAVVCEQAVAGVMIPQFIVPNTTDALATIAADYRRSLHCDVIALTGSNGKTTVKEMIASILPKPSFATPGNLNNHIGAPLSVLQLAKEHQFAVFELGASHQGEIAHTVAVVQPRVTLINNIAPAHIAGFGSIDGVADAKGEIHQGLPLGGTAVINDDDAYAHYWDTILSGKTTIRFSIHKPVDVHARDVRLNTEGCAYCVLVTPLGEAPIQLNVPGRHNVSNALAAAACTYALGISLADIVKGLQHFSGVSGRMTFKAGKNKAVIIDDTYNANLRSVLTALDVLADRQGVRILVLGDMGELGDWAEQHHHDVGLAARQYGIDLVMTCGKQSASTSLAFGPQGKHYDNQTNLTHDLVGYLNAETTVLVKGSRSSAMEKIVHDLLYCARP
ncbi:MAG: UDP-N-acetylmuramoyl-tripeptide--D-alanyl-D-alanine ligase [Legionellaceae bacterium]|nr:UDP-N-acetylmuramoyl-tripeptide--D-alanyl-D-alanine ligase [Legionellaceae bacterium]